MDRTFNLGDVFATVFVYKNTSVYRQDSQDHPIFLGPIMLHGQSTFDEYQSFFAESAGRLAPADLAKMTLGSDDEKAVRNALDSAFPQSTKVLCTRHLKNNTNDYLREKVGIRSGQRQEIVKSIFSQDGLCGADDSIVFEDRNQKCQDL